MSTVIRSAVIEMGIRQLQATLTPPNVAAILDAQKAMEQTGESAVRAASVASAAWDEMAVKIREMQAALLETDDSFEKTLADAVAWEETLPGITANTEAAAEASDHHAAAMGRQFMGLGNIGRGSLTATRGILFLMATDKAHQQQIIENLFLLQGMTDVVRGLGWVYRGWARSIEGVTIASVALKLANPELWIMAAAFTALLSTAGALYNVFTATGNAVRKMGDDAEHNAEQSTKMAQLWELEAEHATRLSEKQYDLARASADLYTERVKLLTASQAAEDLGHHDEAVKLGQRAVEIEKEQLHVHQLRIDANREELEHQIKLIDLKEQELRIEKEKDDLLLGRGSDFLKGPEHRAKLEMLAGQSNNFNNLGALSDHGLAMLEQEGDENEKRLAQREGARRAGNSPLGAIRGAEPVDSATARDRQSKSYDEQKNNINKQIEDGKNQAEHLLTGIIDMLERMQSRVNEIDNSARAKKGSSWGTGIPGVGF